MITAAGSGYSRWQEVAITRWREDSTRDVGGTYVFVREAGEWRIVHHQAGPTPPPADDAGSELVH